MKWLIGIVFLGFAFAVCMLLASWMVEGTTAIVIVAFVILVLCILASIYDKK